MRCAAIVSAEPATRVEGLRLAMLAMADAGAAIVRVGNPQRMALTAGRILLQIDPEQAEPEPDGGVIAAALARRKGRAGQVVLVIEQAETLAADGLLAVQRCSAEPFVRVVFVGAPGFWGLLAGAELGPLRAALAPRVMARARRAVPWWGWWAGGLGGMAAVVVLAVFGGPRWGAGDVLPVVAVPAVLPSVPVPPVSEPAVVAPAVMAPAVVAPLVEVPAAEADVPALPIPPLPPGVLPLPLPPGVPGVPGGIEGRVVVHYRRGSGAGEALAGRLAVAAGAMVGTVQVRETGATPSSPQLRFFHAEDAPRAALLAARLPEPGGPWEVRDFTGFRPRPSAGSIEVWLP